MVKVKMKKRGFGNMKSRYQIAFFALGFLTLTAIAVAGGHGGYVHGYYRSNGTYVNGYWRGASTDISVSGSSGSYLSVPSIGSYEFNSTYLNSQPRTTYRVGGTRYILGDTYQTTGRNKVERNISARQQFRKGLGYNSVPNGFEVDHIIPLHWGGADEPWNMQLLTKEEHERKTAIERRIDATVNSFSH
jgi:hypothetical protein